LSIKVMGMAKTLEQLDKIANSLNTRAIGGISMKLATKIANEAKSKAPLGPTGNLKNSIYAKKGRNAGLALAVVDAKIAPHRALVEYGTEHSAAHPYWRPTIEANDMGILEDIKDKLDKAI
jgi:HK97 gp10 family phage protein